MIHGRHNSHDSPLRILRSRLIASGTLVLLLIGSIAATGGGSRAITTACQGQATGTPHVTSIAIHAACQATSVAARRRNIAIHAPCVHATGTRMPISSNRPGRVIHAPC